MEKVLELINFKIKKYKLLKTINVFLAVMFSLVGVISIVGLLMFFNIMFGVEMITCVILTLVLSQIYSFMINEFILKKIENKINNISSDISKMLEECKVKEKMKLRTNDRSIIQKFESLSLKRKIELLTLVKNDLIFNDRSDYNDLFFSRENESLELDCDSVFSNEGYSRSRRIRK